MTETLSNYIPTCPVQIQNNEYMIKQQKSSPLTQFIIKYYYITGLQAACNRVKRH